jgi:hypothetical protein
LATVAGNTGQLEHAARLLGAAERIRETISYNLEAEENAQLETATTVVRALLTEQAFSASWAEGYAMSNDQAVRYASEQ